MARIEILAIGNELLDGDTQDRDAFLLCRAVAERGEQVERITVVRDEIETIASAAREALDRETTLLVTVGGLGPTPDDVTLGGVARALGRELRLDDSARAFVARRYEDLAQRGLVDSASLSPPREKLARLPVGARWLANDVGTAPGVVVEAHGATVVSLPGPPAELEGMLNGPLRPLLDRSLGGAVRRTRYRLALKDETDFAPIHDRVQPAHPAVHIKSHAPPLGLDHPPLLVTLAARGRDPREAEERLVAAKRDLEHACRETGIGIREEA